MHGINAEGLQRIHFTQGARGAERPDATFAVPDRESTSIGREKRTEFAHDGQAP